MIPALSAQTSSDKGILTLEFFDNQDGLEIGDIHSMVFDDEGWLWMSGLESELGASIFLKNVPKLQWFDGYNFHSVQLPTTDDVSPTKVNLRKRTDGLFYLWVSADKADHIYLFNPSSFEFKHINIPTRTSYANISNVFIQDAALFIILDTEEGSQLLRLKNDLTIDKLFNLRSEDGVSNVYQTIAFQDHFLVSEGRKGIMAYGKNGEVLKQFGYEDFGLKKTANEEVLALTEYFLLNGKYQFVMRNDKGIYQYNDQEMTWSISGFETPDQAPSIKPTQYQNRYVISDSYKNVAWFDLANDKLVIKRDYVSQEFKAQENRIEVIDLANAASKDLKKELFLAAPGRLGHLVFKNTGINNFLEDYSLRSITHYKGSRYLATTESSGFHLIDIEKNSEEQFPLFLNGQPFSASEIRGISIDKHGIWTNYNEGILLVDPITHEVERFRHYPISAMVDDGDRIVYGAINYPLMEFDKVDRVNRPMSVNDSLRVMDLVKFDGGFYATTSNGLFTYKHGKESFVDIPIDSGQLMMLNAATKYGLFITTNDGRVYQMKGESSKPELFFTDEAASPIVSIFEDQQSNLWFASFSGLIRWNPQTQELKRFIEDDGISNNEFNRFSLRQNEDGGVFLGAIRGLNYFYPQNLKKLEKDGEVVLTDLTYFDRKSEMNANITALGDLGRVKHLSLPAENKFLRVQVAPKKLTQATKVNMQYRLNNGNWLPVKQPGEIQFNNLGAGHYTLTVRMVDSEGVSFGDSLELDIHANEFFYRTTWFILLMALLVIFISYYFVYQANKAKALEQNYSRSLLRVQEDERKRISRDLHDSVGQQLVLLKNQANASHSQEIANNVSATLEEVRAITRNLHPVVLSRLGLTAALEEMIRQLDESTEIFFSTDLENIDDIFEGGDELNLYRIIQEALSNIVKHASAASAKLSIQKQNHKVLITIQDNGKGFSIEEEQASGNTLGLKTLQERIAMLNGKLNIASSKTGTIISLVIPK